MASTKRVIIDTDPGVDDVLAMLLAFSASPEEIQVLLLSITFGNVDRQSCLRNVVSTFHIIDRDLEWRRQNGRPEGFESLKNCRPKVAIGAEEPLEEQLVLADYFQMDWAVFIQVCGNAVVHMRRLVTDVGTQHPHLSPDETWTSLFQRSPGQAGPGEVAEAVKKLDSFFEPSHIPAHQEILRLLRENEPDTITIIAVGPLTNLALAAAEDTETFLRAKEIVVMGGAIDMEGNINPVAEFNTCADAVAAARVFALTSYNPSSTFPPTAPAGSQRHEKASLPSYPATLSRPLNLTLFPLDVTTSHCLRRADFEQVTKPLIAAGSPLAEWVDGFLSPTLRHTETSYSRVGGLPLHDPLCIWYILTHSLPTWQPSAQSPEDIRIETAGQWTRGMCVVDRRGKPKAQAPIPQSSSSTASSSAAATTAKTPPTIPGDTDNWLAANVGNRIRRMVGTPGADVFGPYLLKRVFGVET
ncbi:MAG: hypothetical protein M1837_004959 [Sclerophora amabilis]|nr:MAG: hypothetical protein M1837_004959 [Sclerophora amabilis]